MEISWTISNQLLNLTSFFPYRYMDICQNKKLNVTYLSKTVHEKLIKIIGK